MLALLFLRPEVEDQGGTRLQGGDLEARREFVGPDLLVEGLLVSRGQSLAAVLLREGDPREPAVEQAPLQFAVVRDLRELGLVVATALGHHHPDARALGARHVVGEPRPQTVTELLDRFDARVRHSRPPSAPTTW